MPPARTTSLSGPASGPTVGPTSLGVSLAVHGVAVASLVLAFYAPWTPTEPEEGSRQVVAAQMEVTDRTILEEPAEETLAAVEPPAEAVEPIPLDDFADLLDKPLLDPFAKDASNSSTEPRIAAPDLNPERLLEDPELRKEEPAEPAVIEPVEPESEPDEPEPEPEPAVTDAAPEAEAPDPGAIVAPSPIASACPPPAYPRLAERRGWTGTVVLLIDVAADGTVSDVRIESSSGHDILDEAAVAAVRTWRYRPGTLGGEAAGLVVRKPIRFDR